MKDSAANCREKIEKLEAELNQKDAEILYMEGEYTMLSKKIDDQTRALHTLQDYSAQNEVQKKQLAIEVEHIRLENVKFSAFLRLNF